MRQNSLPICPIYDLIMIYKSQSMEIKITDDILPQELQLFLETCLVEKGLVNIPAETHDLLMGDLVARLNQWLMIDVTAAMNEQQVQEFDRFLEESHTQLEIAQYLHGQLSNLAEIYSQAMKRFKDTYLAT